jgi:predicted amidohydrolase
MTEQKTGRIVKIAQLKAVPEPWELERNWQTVERLATPLEGQGIDLLITPECFLDGYVVVQDDWTPERFDTVLQDMDGRYVPRGQALARRLGCWLLLGLTERRGEGRTPPPTQRRRRRGDPLSDQVARTRRS